MPLRVNSLVSTALLDVVNALGTGLHGCLCQGLHPAGLRRPALSMSGARAEAVVFEGHAGTQQKQPGAGLLLQHHTRPGQRSAGAQAWMCRV